MHIHSFSCFPYRCKSTNRAFESEGVYYGIEFASHTLEVIYKKNF